MGHKVDATWYPYPEYRPDMIAPGRANHALAAFAYGVVRWWTIWRRG